MYIIPIGNTCSVAYNAELLGLRCHALPFDWSTSKKLSQIANVIGSDFHDFTNFIRGNKVSSVHDIIQEDYGNREISNTLILSNKYKLFFPHEINTEQFDITPTILKYQRRISRFRELLKSGEELLFVRDDNYHNLSWTDINTFVQLLLDKTDNFRLIIVLSNPDNLPLNKYRNFSPIIINDTQPYTNWKRPLVNWKQIFV